MKEHVVGAFCPYYHQAVELIGRRWTGAIVLALLDGPLRFSDITATIPGLSDRLLSERLKELEHCGIVARTVYAETPIRIDYRLTEKGAALYPAISALSDWAHDWLVEPKTATEPEPALAGSDRDTGVARLP